MELSDGGCFPNLVRNCRWTIVPRQPCWITLYIELKLAESDWRQIGITESAARPAVTRNGPSDEWCDLTDKIMPLYSSSYTRHTRRNPTTYSFKQWRTEGGGGVWGAPPPQKFRRPSKIEPNSTQLWKLLKIAEFRMPTPQDVRKKGSKILKLPSVRNCFKLAMTNELVVIINSLKVPKIKKISLYEMKILVPNYSCLQNPWLRGLPPPDLRSLCPQLNLLTPTPTPNKIPGFATGFKLCPLFLPDFI